MDNTYFIEKAIEWAKKQGFKNIKANARDYEKPTQYNRQGGKQRYIPDVTGTQKGDKNYVEVAIKTDNISRKISKWKLLSTLANMKRGKLFLLAPRGHNAFTQSIVKTHNLNANIVSLNG